MANGLGEYFGSQAQAGAHPIDPNPTRGSVTRRPASPPATGGMGEYFSQSGVGATSTGGMGEYFAQNGMGAVNLGPVRRPGTLRRMASRVSPLAGSLGDASDVLDQAKSGMVTGVAAATTLTALLFATGLRFGAGWIVGKALAPSKAEERTYSWAGAVGTVLFGPLALGAEALYAQNRK